MSLLVANKNQTAEGSNIFSLFVEAWTLIESFDPYNCVTEYGQYSLRIQGTEVSIFKCVPTSVSWFAKHDEVFTLTLGVDISSAEIPRSHNTSMPFVAFLLHQTNDTRNLFDAYASIGRVVRVERLRNPSIAFKIAKGSLGWNSQSYKQIDDLLRTGYISLCYLDDAAIGTRWKILMSACNDSQGAKSSTQSVKLSHNSCMDVDDEDTGRNNADANQSVQSRPPEFNLKAKAKRGRAVLASSPRIGTKKQNVSCVNPTNFARGEDVFISNQPQGQATISQTTQGLLPIRAWVSGTKLVDSLSSGGSEPQYWFRVRGSYVSILNGTPAIGTLLFEFELGADIKIVELPYDHDVAVGFPLVILTLRETERTEHFIKKNTTFDHKRPTLVGIKLSSSHSEWSLTSYKEIESLIKASKVDVRSLNASGVRTRWQTLTRFQGSQALAPCSPYTSSPQTPRANRPKPRPTYVGAEDDAALTSSEQDSDRQLEVVEGSNDAKSQRDDDVKASSGQFTTEPPIWEKVPTPSAVVQNPPAIKLGDASSQREPGIVMFPDSASSEKCLGTLSDFLSRNHQEVKEILEQALDLLDNGNK